MRATFNKGPATWYSHPPPPSWSWDSDGTCYMMMLPPDPGIVDRVSSLFRQGQIIRRAYYFAQVKIAWQWEFEKTRLNRPLPRQHFKMRKATHKKVFIACVFWYIHIGNLAGATGLKPCAEILLEWSVRGIWNTYGDIMKKTPAKASLQPLYMWCAESEPSPSVMAGAGTEGVEEMSNNQQD